MNDFRFLEWNVYKDSKEIVKSIFKLTIAFPNHFRYELGSQLNRSAISIVLNIAEGSGKSSDKDFRRFLNISTGSVYETLAGLDLAKENNLISEKDFSGLHSGLFNIARQLGGFKKKLKNK